MTQIRNVVEGPFRNALITGTDNCNPKTDSDCELRPFLHTSTEPKQFSDVGTLRMTLEFEPLLDSIEAASLLHIHHKTLQRLARRGEIHGTRIGKLWRFRASDLNEWLRRQKRAS